MGVLYEANATIGTTEYSLTNNSTTIAAKTDVGPIFAFLELHNLVAGDEYVFTIYEKVQSGSTQRVLDKIYIAGAQSRPVLALPALRLRHGWDITGDKLTGTDRNIGWRIEN